MFQGYQEVQYYVAIWLFAAFAGLARAASDRRIDSAGDFVAIGSLSGFLGFVVFGFAVRVSGGHVGSEPLFLAIAGLVGLAGKENTKFISDLARVLITAVIHSITKIKIPLEPQDDEPESKDDSA